MLCVLLALAAAEHAAVLDDALVDDAVAAVTALHLAQAKTTDTKTSPKGKSTSSTDHGDVPTLRAAGSSSTPLGKQIGIGLQLGYPTGLTVKYMLQPDQGIVGGLGGLSGFAYDAGAFDLHVDYVWHPNLLTAAEPYQVTWYVGGGGTALVFGNPHQHTAITGLTYYYYPTNLWLGARMPIGVNLALTQMPLEIYLEGAPQLLIFPGLTFGLGVAIGARFYI